MSSNLYTQQGVDFDVWFTLGTGTQFVDIYGDSGQDIGQRYLAGGNGPETNWKVANGADLNTLFGGYGYGIYRVGGVPWNVYLGDAYESWWTNWLKTFASKRTTCKNISGIMNDSYYRSVCSDNRHSICIFGYAPPGGAEISFNYVERNREYGCGNRSHYMRTIPVTISANLKGVIIWRACGAGDDPCSEYYVTLSRPGEQTLYYDGIYGCINDDNNPVYGTSGWNQWKWGKQWIWHP